MEGRGQGILRRRAPLRGRAAEAHRQPRERPRRGAQGQGKRDPRSLMAAAEQRASANGRSAVGERDSEREPASESASASEAQPTARYVAIITDGNGRWARERG